MELYVERGSWKCSASPFGAHHYMLGMYPGDDESPLLGTCKYCGEQRRYPRWVAPKGKETDDEAATSKVA